MARPVRVEFENAVYHVTARGNERKDVYRDVADRQRFLETLEEAVGRFGVVVHAYCLLDNHYHLLLQTPRANLTGAIGWLQATYSIRFNRRHKRSGHLFQGRFKAHLVEADQYARQLIKYIHLNPVRPKDKRRPVPLERRAELARYRWSSHRAYAGLGKADTPAWLCTEWLSYFGRTPKAARAAYRGQIAEMFGQVVPSPWQELRGGLVLGGEALWETARRALADSKGDDEIRWSQRAGVEALAGAIDRLAVEQTDRRLAIWLEVRHGGRQMTDVARRYGYRDGSGVHRVIQRLEARAQEDCQLARTLESLKASVSSVKS